MVGFHGTLLRSVKEISSGRCTVRIVFDTLVQQDTHFRCERGDMTLSVHMARHLWTSFIDHSEPHREPVPSTFRWGGNWFCPHCGVKMREIASTNGVLCPKYGGNLGPMIYELIEFNYHRLPGQMINRVTEVQSE